MPTSADRRAPDVTAAVAARLRAAGLRMTHQRATVLAALAAAGTHPTAESVAERAAELDPGIHLATVYRTLHVLEEHGVVSHVHLGHGPAVYHLAHEQHAHAVCRVCGHAVEVPDHLLRALTDELRERLGFTLDPGHFALSGWCQHCPRHGGPDPSHGGRRQDVEPDAP